MYTSVAFLSLTGLLGGQPAPAPTPTWMTDYWQAQAKGQREGRPLAVFIGSGQNGFHQVCREGALTANAQKILGQKYICVYLDVSRTEARKLANTLEIPQRGLVISDRAGRIQAFHHNGDLVSTDLVRNLERFGDPNMNVRTTENNSRVSYYPSSNGGFPPATYGSFGGRGC